MKFKGFWKSYWELTKESIKWMKDYWLLYSILIVILSIVTYISTLVYFLGWDNFKSCFTKRTDEKEVEEFLD